MSPATPEIRSRDQEGGAVSSEGRHEGGTFSQGDPQLTVPVCLGTGGLLVKKASRILSHDQIFAGEASAPSAHWLPPQPGFSLPSTLSAIPKSPNRTEPSAPRSSCRSLYSVKMPEPLRGSQSDRTFGEPTLQTPLGAPAAHSHQPVSSTGRGLLDRTGHTDQRRASRVGSLRTVSEKPRVVIGSKRGSHLQVRTRRSR